MLKTTRIKNNLIKVANFHCGSKKPDSKVKRKSG